MSSMLQIFSPANQNQTQKVGFILSIILSLLVLFLHFPFDGYDSERSNSSVVRKGTGRCPQPTLEGVLNMDKEQLDKLVNQKKECQDEVVTTYYTLPMEEWRTKSPIIYWFGSLTNAAISITFLISIGALWVLFFKNVDSKRS